MGILGAERFLAAPPPFVGRLCLALARSHAPARPWRPFPDLSGASTPSAGCRHGNGAIGQPLACTSRALVPRPGPAFMVATQALAATESMTALLQPRQLANDSLDVDGTAHFGHG